MQNIFSARLFNRLICLGGLALTFLLAACGGGGGGSTTSTPTVTASINASTLAPTQGTNITLTWSSTNATSCTASGSWSGALATSGTQTVTPPSATTYNYTITCSDSSSNSGTDTVSVTARSLASNVLPMAVDSGPQGNSFNQPFVSVTICQPGTHTCQTIDHVLVDTGSFGLRLMDSALNSNMKTLPAVTSGSNQVGTCAQFISGYMWGSVRRADITLGGETAYNLPIQHIGDTTVSSKKASSCTGSDFGTVSALGAKGILGVGNFKQDCGNYCVSNASAGMYFSCTSANCNTGTTLPLASQVANPVAYVTNNTGISNTNGVILDLPAVAADTGVSSLSGSLILGIDTQSNNALGSAVKYAVSSLAYFKTTYQSTDMNSSFIDSGSNGLFFPDIGSLIPNCTSGWYCPVSTMTINATNAGYSGTPSNPTSINLVNMDNISNTAVAARVGADSGGTTSFDWGLPFFFGHKVYTAIEGTDPSYTYGYWAY